MDQALSRIEAALSRIAAAADRLGNGDPDLAARHDALRAAVGDTLKELDTLIGSRGATSG